MSFQNKTSLYLSFPTAAAPQYLPMFFLPFVWHICNLFPSLYKFSSSEFSYCFFMFRTFLEVLPSFILNTVTASY
jgi:hypothetical protein